MKRALNLVIGFATLAVMTGPAAQSSYPDKPVHIFVGFPVGGSTDIVTRLLGQKLSAGWSQAVLVENVPGATGMIAADRAAKSKPDGYTLIMAGSAAIVINQSLYGKLTYDPIRDLAPVSQVYSTAGVLAIHNGVPAHSVQKLIALAKAQPGRLTFASPGSGTSLRLAAELFKIMASIDIVHVPYKGNAPAVFDLVAGRVTMMFGSLPDLLPHVRDGKLRALAVTSAKRSSVAPELPTIAELGFPGIEATFWFGLLAPAGTPTPIVRKIHADAVKALALSDARERFADLGLEPIGNSPEEFAQVIRAEIPKWAKVIKDSGAKPD
jgi:tripartite-type tricarboxylate transporter receptor subunit TctC